VIESNGAPLPLRTKPPPRLKSVLLSLGYGAGSFGANVAVFPAISLILYFLTDTIGMSIAIATIVITLPKVWDMLVDPAIGAYADRYARQRGNRFFVFLPLAAILPVVSALVFVLPRMPEIWFAAAAVIALTLKSTFYTVFLVSHVAAADDIGVSGAAPRNAMLAVRIVGQAGGGLAAGAIAPLLLALSDDKSSNYRWMAATLAVAGSLGLLACAFALRGVPTQGVGEKAERTNMLTAVRSAFARPVALGLIISNFSVTVSAAFLANALPYINKYVLREPDTALSPMFSALMGAMLLGAIGSAWLSARLGNRRALQLAGLWLITAALLFYPASGQIATMVAVLAGWGVGMGSYTVVLQSSLLDEARGEGAVAGLVGLLLGLLFAIGKLGDTLGGVLTGAILASAGGTATLAANQGAGWLLRGAFGLVPALLVSAGLVILLLLSRRAVRLC
jgi:GPH family glycoside/pentoside/hexuronide:cation symporter